MSFRCLDIDVACQQSNRSVRFPEGDDRIAVTPLTRSAQWKHVTEPSVAIALPGCTDPSILVHFLFSFPCLSAARGAQMDTYVLL